MELSGVKKKMIITICVLLAVAASAAALYYRSLSCFPFIYGLLLGSAVSIAKVFMLARAVDKSLTKDSQSAANFIRFNHLLRLALTGAALLIAAFAVKLWDMSVLWGAAAGVLFYQIAVYALKFTTKKESANGIALVAAEPEIQEQELANNEKDTDLEELKVRLKQELKEEIRAELRAELSETARTEQENTKEEL